MTTNEKLMRCPWCGDTLYQTTKSPGTPEFKSTGECRHCGYRYEATFDPGLGKIIETMTSGRGVRSHEPDNPTLGPPFEVSAEYWAWINQQMAEADMLYDFPDDEDDDQPKAYWND